MFLFPFIFGCRSYLSLGAVDESYPFITDGALMSVLFTVCYLRSVKIHIHTNNILLPCSTFVQINCDIGLCGARHQFASVCMRLCMFLLLVCL